MDGKWVQRGKKVFSSFSNYLSLDDIGFQPLRVDLHSRVGYNKQRKQPSLPKGALNLEGMFGYSFSESETNPQF